ncbi:VWA domain-containing protein [Litoribrevibacter albus]|uniref:Transporter n=1 Tax=Litoribrevibacter albus TaxID=1473156 RepID=A0AA37S8W0_9GAMM|nr:VWA domain-containing protein [Litoribrevibacter albus]GLQ30728.1 transporter [Litoribrevibacter albus]
MDAFFDSFHFARPLWFLALIPVVVAIYYFLNQVRSAQLWSKHIAPELLSQLTDKQSGSGKSYLFSGLVGVLLTLCIVALAGPSFESQQVKTLKTDDTLVVIMDLSLSMMAQDMQPSRLQRMKFKLQDLLDKRKTGYTALIVYSGDAHVVVPLTEDADTIKHLAKTLSPWMIPSKGSRLSRAVEEANKLLDAYPSSNARILLLTDEISDQQLDKTLAISNYPTFVIGVGTEAGAPIPLPDGKLLKDNQQNIVITKFIDEQPKALAKKTGGIFSTLNVDDSDITPALSFEPNQSETPEALQQMAAIKDYGYLLLIPALFLMLMSFRKGWLLAVGFILINPTDGFAVTSQAESPSYQSSLWDDLWLNQSQQAQKAYDQKDYATAAKLFSDPLKKADAYAKNKQWQLAEESYRGQPSATAKYNLANVQAEQGKLDESIQSYQAAIDAAKQEHNQTVLDRAKKDKAAIEALKKQQEQQQNQQSKDGQEGQDGQQDNSDQSDQQSSDQQSSDGQNSDQQSGQDQSNEGQSNDSQSNEGQSGQNKDEQQGANGDSSNSNQDPNSDTENSQQSQGSNKNQDASNQQSSSSSSDAGLDEEQAQSAAQKAQANEAQMQDGPTDGQKAQGAQATNSEPYDQNDVTDYQQGSAVQSSMEPSQEDIEEQKYQQILRKVQSDPSVLLENKFRIQHYQRNKPENEAQVW